MVRRTGSVLHVVVRASGALQDLWTQLGTRVRRFRVGCSDDGCVPHLWLHHFLDDLFCDRRSRIGAASRGGRSSRGGRAHRRVPADLHNLVRGGSVHPRTQRRRHRRGEKLAQPAEVTPGSASRNSLFPGFLRPLPHGWPKGRRQCLTRTGVRSYSAVVRTHTPSVQSDVLSDTR